MAFTFGRFGKRSRAGARRFADFDPFSPPVIVGAVFIILFGVGALDAHFADETGRLRRQFVFYRGISLEPLLYLALAYCAFAAGHWLKPAASIIRHIRPQPRIWAATRARVIIALSFAVTFAVLVAYTMQVGYGRYQGEGNEALANLSLLGELSLIPYALALTRDAQFRSNIFATGAPLWDRLLLWGVMFPGQLIFSITIGIRSRVVTVLLIALAAQHYAVKRIRTRTLAAISIFLLIIVVPALGVLRSNEATFTPLVAWESLAGRTSAVETFTMIYENLDVAPDPDPLSWTVVTGLVPRFLWPNKPLSDASERLTYWAVGSAARSAWAGPTLPGEFLMHFGYIGAILGMAVLGMFWRLLSEIARPDEKSPWIAVYLVAIPTLLTVETGFVLPYSVLIRFVAVAVVTFLASTSTSQRSVKRAYALVGGGEARGPIRSEAIH